MVDLAGNDRCLPSDLLVGELGLRVVNMLITPAMFARLAPVNSDVLNIVRSADAWEGLEIHLEHHVVCILGLARMIRIWRRANVLYLHYPDACLLNDHCRILSILYPFAADCRRCSIAADWMFVLANIMMIRDMGFFLYKSSAELPAGREVLFDLELPSHTLPQIDVGWISEHDIGEHLCFRVVQRGTRLRPSENRARWYGTAAMSGDTAIRVPVSWARRGSLTVGLVFTDTSMTLRINDRRWEAEIEPDFRGRWLARDRRFVFVALSDSVRPLPILEPRPLYVHGVPSD